MKLERAFELASAYRFVYLVSISVRRGFVDVDTVYRLVYRYLHSHDKLARFISVKEYGKSGKNPHYHVLYFTDKELDYSKLHSYLKRHGLQHYDVNVEKVRKTEKDIADVVKYLSKEK